MNYSSLAEALDIAVPAVLAVAFAFATRRLLQSYEERKSIWKGVGIVLTAILAFVFAYNTFLIVRDLSGPDAAATQTTVAPPPFLTDAETVWCNSPRGFPSTMLAADTLRIIDLPTELFAPLRSMASDGVWLLNEEQLAELDEALAPTRFLSNPYAFNRPCKAAFASR